MQVRPGSALFHRFNAAYFGGRLAACRVSVRHRIPGCDFDGLHLRKKRIILLRWLGDERLMTSTLLHEMAHAAANDHHGPRWITEMRRTKGEGAPVEEIELEQQMLLTRPFVLGAAKDALFDKPELTLRRFASWFAVQYTGKESGQALLRAFPWVAKVFRDAAIEMQRMEDQRLTSWGDESRPK